MDTKWIIAVLTVVSRKITNDCFIFNGRRQLCVLCEIMMMMMMHDRCCLFVVIDFVRWCEFSAVSENRFFSSTTMHVPIVASLL